MNLQKPIDTEYLKCTKLLSELIQLDPDTEEQINKYFQSMGITNFFQYLELADLPQETFEKLKNIKSIIEILEEKGVQE